MVRPPACGNIFVNALLASLPELEHFPSPEARERAIRDHVKTSRRGWGLVTGIGTTILVVAVTFAALGLFLPYILPATAPIREIAIVGTLVAHIACIRALYRWGAATTLRKHLILEGVPVCLRCGYLLNGLSPGTGHCPECGREISEGATTLLAKPASAAD